MANPRPRFEWPFRVPPPPAAVPPSYGGDGPSFSVIVPAYEAARWIADAVRSLLAQTLPAREIIVVDDGSTDDPIGALAELASRVTVARIGHAGSSAARNEGVRVASGEFVAFLDADDVYEPDFIRALSALSQYRPDLDILTADVRFVTDGRPRGTFFGANDFPLVDQRAAILQRCYLTSHLAVRRSAFVASGGFDPSLSHGEDWDCWLRLILGGASAGLVDLPLSQYRQHGHQMSANRGASLWGRVQVLAKVADSTLLSPQERRAVRETIVRLAQRAALTAAAESGGGLRARRAWIAVAARPAMSMRIRLLGLLGAASPGLAAARARRSGAARAWPADEPG
jgi:hypothetical protein